MMTASEQQELQACARNSTQLTAYLAALQMRQTQLFDAGAPAAQLLGARADAIDALLQHLWRAFGLYETGMTLVAVGGYGRRELHPHSDVDLLLLTSDKNSASNASTANAELPTAALEQFIALLWDLKLDIGHSVRSVSECAAQASSDISVLSNLLDARFIAGEPILLVKLQQELSPTLLWPPDAFFRGKVEEQQQRHRKFEGTAYKLEPNLKSSPGGLRDIQTLYWIAKRRFGDSSLQAFTRRGLLSISEFRALSRCLQFLWKVRYALHLCAGRAEDRLLFDLQVAVAERLGYSDSAEKSAVEQFMKQYFRCVLTVRNLNELLLQLFDEALIGRLGEIAPSVIDDYFQSRDGQIECRQAEVFSAHPHTLLLIFVHLAEQPALTGVSAPTWRVLRETRSRITSEYRAHSQHQQLWLRLWRARGNLANALFIMKNTGVLGAMVPSFATITGQMQFDRFHHYTVDEHTLFLLRNLIRLAEPQTQTLFVHAAAIMQAQVAPEIIYMAGLFHDIGKGRGGDHAELGALDAGVFCREMGFADDDGELVAWLVQKHLIMSHTAQRKDITDPDVIAEFALHCGSEQKLELLYVLTMCDIRATNASLWNGWKDALLRDLFLASRDYLRQGHAPTAADLAARNRAQARHLLSERHLPEAAIQDLWRELGPDYFNKVNHSQLAWVTESLLNYRQHHESADTPLVRYRQNIEQGGTEWLIYLPDQDALFAAITALFAQKKVSIQTATIHTTNHSRLGAMGLDSFIALEENGEPITEPARLQSIQRHLSLHLRDTAKVVLNLNLAPTRRTPFKLATSIRFTDDSRQQRTAIEIITLDRPGLLARIGAAFKLCGVVLHNAKIVTLGERAEDVFFVSNKAQGALDAEQQAELEAQLHSFIDTPPQAKKR